MDRRRREFDQLMVNNFGKAPCFSIRDGFPGAVRELPFLKDYIFQKISYIAEIYFEVFFLHNT